jgi:lipoyl-dependent peroxiredoxin
MEENHMSIRKSTAIWNGNLKEGKGTMRVGNGAYEGPFTFASRFESSAGTNPEELLGAAHAGCFSMALSADLGNAGYNPQKVSTTAKVHLDNGPKISLIELETEAEVPGIDEATFQKIAEGTKKNCPVSKALAAVEISLNAKLVK